MAHDVFISYASPDAAIATAVCDSLEANGIAWATGGVLIQVDTGSPAAVAGLRGGNAQVTIKGVKHETGGDLLVAVNSVPLGSGSQLVRLISAHHPSDGVALTLYRGRKLVKVRVTLAAPQSP